MHAQAGTGSWMPGHYAGHLADPDSGLVHMQARWYEAESGTFLSVDPVVADAADPQSYNAYAYARGNPILYDDPTGMCVLVTVCFSFSYSSVVTSWSIYYAEGTFNDPHGERAPVAGWILAISWSTVVYGGSTAPVGGGIPLPVTGGGGVPHDGLTPIEQIEAQGVRYAQVGYNEADFIRDVTGMTDDQLTEAAKEFGIELGKEAGKLALEGAALRGVGPAAAEAATVGRAAVQAGKAIARNPATQLNAMEGVGNFARGYRHGRGLRTPGKPYGGSVGAYVGYYSGYGLGAIQKFLGLVDDLQ